MRDLREYPDKKVHSRTYIEVQLPLHVCFAKKSCAPELIDCLFAMQQCQAYQHTSGWQCSPGDSCFSTSDFMHAI